MIFTSETAREAGRKGGQVSASKGSEYMAWLNSQRKTCRGGRPTVLELIAREKKSRAKGQALMAQKQRKGGC